MMRNLKKIGSLLIGLCFSGTSSWAATAARAVGSGIAYPTLNHAMHVNPAALAESPSASLQGLYDFDGHNIFGSGTIGQNGFGAGFSYTRLDAADSSSEAFGVGAKLGRTMLGVNITSQEFKNFGIGAGLALDFSSFRLASTVQGLDDGVTGVDVGVGFDRGMWGAEIDVAKSLADGTPSNEFTFSAGIHAMVQSFSLGGGYSFKMTGSTFSEKHFFGGLSLAVTRGISIEGFYKADGAQIALGDWSAGARFQF